MSHSIYGLYDPTDEARRIRYIGYSSKPLNRRLIQHVWESKEKAKCHRHKWIRSLLRKGVEPAIVKIESVAAENWQARERYWISFYWDRLVNSTKGGEGLIGPSEEVRKAISAKVSAALMGNQLRKGIPHDEQSKSAISAGLRASAKKRASDDARRGKPGRKLTDEAKLKISEANKGKKHPPRSDEWREKQKAAQSGKKQTEETIKKRAATLIGNNRRSGKPHSDVSKSAIAASRIGGKWINNGIETRYMKANEVIPPGWNTGRCKKET